MSSNPNYRATTRILREDPDLGEALSPADFSRAEARALARVMRLETGDWPPLEPPSTTMFGFLVLDGLLGNTLRLPERAHLELLGPGDVLRPWVGLGPDATTPSRLEWQVFEEARLAVLDRSFCVAICDVPEIYEALAERLVLRSRRLNFQMAVNALTSVEERLLIALWHFADRWGRVRPEGVTLSLPLPHRNIADIVGASRPSVSTALMSLRRAEMIEPLDGGWLLRGRPPARLAEIAERAALAA